MEQIPIAHVREWGLDLVLVPLDDSFHVRSEDNQRRVLSALQACATIAGIGATVIPVWDAGDGRMAFLAPVDVHPFLQTIDLGFVVDHLNDELYWGSRLDIH